MRDCRLFLPLILFGAVVFCSGPAGSDQAKRRLLTLPVDVPVMCEPDETAAGSKDDADQSAQAEAKCLRTLSIVARRDDNVLSLKLDNGRTKVFRDNSESCSERHCASYKLIGLLTTSRMYIVRETESELRNDILVPIFDAPMESMASPIHFSPGGGLALSVSDNDGPSSRDYSIKLLKLSPDGIELVFSFYNQEAWEFVSIRNDEDIRVRVGEGSVETERYDASLKKDRFGTWHMTRLDGGPNKPAVLPR